MLRRLPKQDSCPPRPAGRPYQGERVARAGTTPVTPLSDQVGLRLNGVRALIGTRRTAACAVRLRKPPKPAHSADETDLERSGSLPTPRPSLTRRGNSLTQNGGRDRRSAVPCIRGPSFKSNLSPHLEASQFGL